MYVSAPLRVTFGDRKIRERDERIRWWASQSDDKIDAPFPASQAKSGDLYIHAYGATIFQIWLRGESEEWLSIKEAHPHPTIKGHALRMLSNGRPRWVTTKTLTTYASRARKLARQAAAPGDGR